LISQRVMSLGCVCAAGRKSRAMRAARHRGRECGSRKVFREAGAQCGASAYESVPAHEVHSALRRVLRMRRWYGAQEAYCRRGGACSAAERWYAQKAVRHGAYDMPPHAPLFMPPCLFAIVAAMPSVSAIPAVEVLLPSIRAHARCYTAMPWYPDNTSRNFICYEYAMRFICYVHHAHMFHVIPPIPHTHMLCGAAMRRVERYRSIYAVLYLACSSANALAMRACLRREAADGAFARFYARRAQAQRAARCAGAQLCEAPSCCLLEAAEIAQAYVEMARRAATQA